MSAVLVPLLPLLLLLLLRPRLLLLISLSPYSL
jgi:hypothetical protein